MNVDDFATQIESIRDIVTSSGTSSKTASRWLGVLELLLEELDFAIEELREQNEELRLNQHLVGAETEHYRGLFELAPEGYIETDAFGVIREANRSASDLLHVDSKGLHGKPLSVYIVPKDRRAFRRLMSDAIADWFPRTLELSVAPRERVPFNAELSVRCGQTISGESTSLHWIVRNITERNLRLVEERMLSAKLKERTEAAAIELEQLLVERDASRAREDVARRETHDANERLGLLSRATAKLSASLDGQTSLDLLLSFVVPAVADWGVIALLDDADSLNEVAVAHRDERLHEQMQFALRNGTEPGSMICCAGPVLESGVPQFVAKGERFSTRFKAPETFDWFEVKDPMELSVMCVPLRSRNRTLGVLEIGRSNAWSPFSTDDLALTLELTGWTSLVLDNARLFERSKTAAIARDHFLAVAAHELRTPITIFRGYSQILSRQLSGERPLDNQRARRMAVEIQKQADHLAMIVEQLVDVSRAESGQLAIQPAVVDISEMVTEQVDVLRQTTDQHQISAHIVSDCFALVDAVRFEQVISNLLENAVKFSTNGGSIDVSLECPVADNLRITVADHGIGIEPGYRDQIFDRFYLGHNRPEIRGLGLGLYISREIMRLHGGDLWAEYPDVGTKFIAELPYSESIHA